MDKQKIQEKLKKIKELAERGVGGEQEGAEQLYHRLLLKYGLEDSEICDEVKKRYVKYHDELAKQLFTQIHYKVTGDPEYFVMKDKRRKEIGFFCTDFEYDLMMFYFNLYIDELRKELKTFMNAFMQVNRLFPDSSARCYTEKEEEDLDLSPERIRELEKMFSMMKGMDGKTPALQIENKNK